MLTGQTKNAFENFEDSEVYILSTICLKNIKTKPMQFATISHENAYNKNYIIKDRSNHNEIKYNSLEDMLNAGWVID